MGSGFASPVATAQSVLEEHELNRLPINVEKLCDELEIKVYYVDFSAIEAKVGKEISGAIQKRGDKYTILVNEDDSDVRARFTIAHELGHFFLHMKDDQRAIVTSFRRDRSPRETEANKFAAELLMPRKLVKKEYEQMVIPVSSTLAKRFKVSKPAMCNRLDSLKLTYV